MENTSTSLSTRKRSIGVTIFGWFYILFSICGFMTLIAAILEWQGMLYIFAMLGQILLFLGMGIGLLKLREWARKLVVYLNIIVVLLFIARTLWLYVFTPESSLFPIGIMAIFTIVPILLLIIYFFTRPKVKALFSPSKPTTLD